MSSEPRRRVSGNDRVGGGLGTDTNRPDVGDLRSVERQRSCSAAALQPNSDVAAGRSVKNGPIPRLKRSPATHHRRRMLGRQAAP
jgi:hypothetical protein